MCSIVGAIYHELGVDDVRAVNKNLNWLMMTGHVRGRDGRGYALIDETPIQKIFKSTERTEDWRDQQIITHCSDRGTFIANCRAEPTTEFVLEKTPMDQQPYSYGGWHIVHNGTIANDKELRRNLLSTRIDSAAIVEQLHVRFPLNSNQLDVRVAFETFKTVVQSLKGSYAILAAHNDLPGVVFSAANYRPIWFAMQNGACYFASTRKMFPPHMVPEMLQPYSACMFAMGANGDVLRQCASVRASRPNRRALVVCSGGLDSVVAATQMKAEEYDVHLIHFMYGSRAERPEVEAIGRVAEYLGVTYTLFPLPVYKPGDSPLLDAAATVAGGEAGAEFAHEWVPARNLLLLSVATAFAEANNYDTIVLGNNLEEAGAYPDNEPEFIDRFNDILPFSVGDGKNVKVHMPVGNLMKHEIVKRGLELKAPLHLTWSCYRAGEKHCGTCGPCYMRRKAFEINNADEVIDYAF